jgi:uncharacterized membrane protein
MASNRVGFAHPILAKRGRRRRALALAELVATVALAVSILVAVTAVSIGIARADTLLIEGNGSRWALAVLLGLFIVGMGGITAFVA